MSKLIAIHSSPRKNSNSTFLLNKAVESITEKSVYNIHDIEFADCDACDACAKSGRCKFNDAATEILDEIFNEGRLIVALPLYFFGVPARLKSLIDRAQYLYRKKYSLREILSKQELKTRKGAAIITAASSVDNLFDGADMTLKYFFDALQIPFNTKLYQTGLNDAGAAFDNDEIIFRASEMAPYL